MAKLVLDTDNLSTSDAEEIFRLANILYFKNRAFEKTHWMGRPAAKCPMDMWMYQELIVALKTDLVIETGTFAGGSALYFAHLFDLIGHGKVISVDLNIHANLPQHPRIEYLQGSSTSPAVLAKVSKHIETASSVTVILDSDHTASYKLKELHAYSEFVTRGNYIVAEDSCFDHYPAWPEFGPGPAQAADEFAQQNKKFRVDRFPELHQITFAPKAFLKRIA